jgi:putative addiction module component (TIGR02574 family)
MRNATDRILDEALQLSIAERARLAAELIASIDGPPDADAEEAWAAEVERRARRAVDGDSVGEDWENVRRRVGDKLRKQ